MWYWKDRWTISYLPGWDRWIFWRTHLDRFQKKSYQLHPSKANTSLSLSTLPPLKLTACTWNYGWLVDEVSFVMAFLQGRAARCSFLGVYFHPWLSSWEISDSLAMFDSKVPAVPAFDRKNTFREGMTRFRALRPLHGDSYGSTVSILRCKTLVHFTVRWICRSVGPVYQDSTKVGHQEEQAPQNFECRAGLSNHCKDFKSIFPRTFRTWWTPFYQELLRRPIQWQSLWEPSMLSTVVITAHHGNMSIFQKQRRQNALCEHTGSMGLAYLPTFGGFLLANVGRCTVPYMDPMESCGFVPFFWWGYTLPRKGLTKLMGVHPPVFFVMLIRPWYHI